jgi:hypothetical protein
MRPLSPKRKSSVESKGVCLLALLAAQIWALGCGGVKSSASPPPPPPSVAVTVSTTSNSVLLGNSVTFTATVTNTADTTVSWSVSGVAGGNSTLGIITSSGVYTAPADLPSPTVVQVTATSHADPTKSGSANETIISDITQALSPNPASVELGAAQAFHATVTSSGHPDLAIRWSVSGAACPGACGAVDSAGNYTAPQNLPSPATVTLTAQSAADPSKQVSAAIAITSNFTLQLAAPTSVSISGSTTIVATLTPVPGSNPSSVLAWALSGPGCSGSSCGTLSVITTQSAGGNRIATSATYTAPAAAPSPNTVMVTVTPQADPSKKAQAPIAIQQGVAVNVSPLTATLAANHRVTLTVQLAGTTNTGVTWNVNGVAGGNTTLGQICVVGSNPCQTVTSTTAAQVDFLAPGAIPSPNPVSATAVSAADSTRSRAAIHRIRARNEQSKRPLAGPGHRLRRGGHLRRD